MLHRAADAEGQVEAGVDDDAGGADLALVRRASRASVTTRVAPTRRAERRGDAGELHEPLGRVRARPRRRRCGGASARSIVAGSGGSTSSVVGVGDPVGGSAAPRRRVRATVGRGAVRGGRRRGRRAAAWPRTVRATATSSMTSPPRRASVGPAASSPRRRPASSGRPSACASRGARSRPSGEPAARRTALVAEDGASAAAHAAGANGPASHGLTSVADAEPARPPRGRPRCPTSTARPPHSATASAPPRRQRRRPGTGDARAITAHRRPDPLAVDDRGVGPAGRDAVADPLDADAARRSARWYSHSTGAGAARPAPPSPGCGAASARWGGAAACSAPPVHAHRHRGRSICTMPLAVGPHPPALHVEGDAEVLADDHARCVTISTWQPRSASSSATEVAWWKPISSMTTHVAAAGSATPPSSTSRTSTHVGRPSAGAHHGPGRLGAGGHDHRVGRRAPRRAPAVRLDAVARSRRPSRRHSASWLRTRSPSSARLGTEAASRTCPPALVLLLVAP